MVFYNLTALCVMQYENDSLSRTQEEYEERSMTEERDEGQNTLRG